MKTKKDRLGTCKYKCARTISVTERQNLFELFCSLLDTRTTFTTKQLTKWSRGDSGVKSKAGECTPVPTFLILVKAGFAYVRSTLNIGQRSISYYFEVKHDSSSSTPNQCDMRGKLTKDRVPQESKDFVRVHINSFPRVESHYCRASTQQQYLEQDLSQTQMYRLYLEKCEQQGLIPVKDHIYRTIFLYRIQSWISFA